jgi:hypothetical protein
MKKLVLIFLLFTSSVNGKEDSLRVLNNFFLELGAGPGIYNSHEGYFSNEYFYFNDELTINLFSKFYYKNSRIRSGINFTYTYSNSYLNAVLFIDGSINTLSKRASAHFFGPTIAYGYFVKTKFSNNLGQRFFKFGADYFYNKFHFGLNYQWIAFKDAPFRTNSFKTTHIYLEVGYAFNFESFKRKQN